MDRKNIVFEVPIFAFNEREFQNRYIKAKMKFLKDESFQNSSEKEKQMAVDIQFSKQIATLYNHVVGYVVVECDTMDFTVKIFLPFNLNKRYIWHSKWKTFLREDSPCGYHFRYEGMTEKQIKKKIKDMVEEIANKSIPKKFYFDLRYIDRMLDVLNFKKIVKIRQEEL